MRVLHICAIGFTVKVLLIPQINYLLSRGLSVEIACSPGADTDELKKQYGYIIHPITIARRISPVSNLISIFELVKLMRSRQYDVVHVHTSVAAVLGRIAARLAGVKTVIYTSHGFPFHALSPIWEYHLYHAIESASAKLTDLIYISNYEDIEMIKHTNLCSMDKVRYIGSDGVDLERFNPQNLTIEHQTDLINSLKIPETAKFIIGTVGRMTKKKGSADLIEAVAKLRDKFPDIHALIVGGIISSDPDSFESELMARIRELKLEKHITLTGYREDIPEIMGLMDIFVLPTYTHEGLPTVIIEAMGMEKPVVATDVRGCREAVINGKTGFIVPSKNPELLANAIATLLDDPQKCRDMGLAGRQRVQGEYDINLVLQRLAKGYEDLGILSA